jgi:hypothetical protein
MKIFVRFALAVAFAAIPAFCQARFSSTTGNVSLTSAGTTFTIQQPASNGKLITLEAATVYCSAACSATQTQNGTGATATAGTVNPILPWSAVPVATVWTASNVGTGVPVGGILQIAGGAGTDRTFDLHNIVLGPGGGTGSNYSIVIASTTATVNITLVWNER